MFLTSGAEAGGDDRMSVGQISQSAGCGVFAYKLHIRFSEGAVLAFDIISCKEQER